MSSRLRVLVNGAFGRMGQITASAIQAHPTLELVGGIGHSANLQQAILDSRANIVIDFTHPAAVFDNINCMIKTKVHPIIGTSGLNSNQIKQLQEQCAQLQLGGIIAPNFSLGAVLMMKHAKEIVKYFSHVEIIEMHHMNKIDSPSGTALHTAEMLSNNSYHSINASTVVPSNKTVTDSPALSPNETIPGARGATYRHIPIHSIRLPGLLSHQQIIFGSTGETLTLRHDSISRKSFIPGILLACEKVTQLNQLVYGLEELL